jgi:hypothetical protein
VLQRLLFFFYLFSTWQFPVVAWPLVMSCQIIGSCSRPHEPLVNSKAVGHVKPAGLQDIVWLDVAVLTWVFMAKV